MRPVPLGVNNVFSRDIDVIAVGTATASTTQGEIDTHRVGAARRDGTGDGQTAITTAATNGLRQDAVGVIAHGRDLFIAGHADYARRVAGTAGATNADTDACGLLAKA